MKTVVLYTDGACRGNPGPGGWGVVVKTDGKESHLSGACPLTTNNQMELTAAIQGLKSIANPCAIKIWTDSKYVKDGITQWIKGWKGNNWRTSAGKPVKNLELWLELDAACQQHLSVEWHWVRGHSGDVANELADKLATDAISKHLG